MQMLYTRWKDINWTLTRSKVFEWQQAIYSASKSGDIRKVRKYQRRIIGSLDAKLLAVRKITQDNKKKLRAGMDEITFIAPNQRLTLAQSLRIPSKPSPLKRMWIYKSDTSEKRCIGIPTIKDRCLQVLFKLALEPEWEAKFEENSYGLRPGRNSHDAIAAIRSFIQKRSKYILEATIAKDFDSIDHEKLLNKIGMIGGYRKQLKYWLKNGIFDGDPLSQTEFGTFQNNDLSPLLANIVLHGIENFCKNLIKEIPVVDSTGKLIKPSRRMQTLGFIRYADNFVIIHPDLSVIMLLQKKMPEFLREIGFEHKSIQMRVTHTLEINMHTLDTCPGLDGKPGFNFLGFYIRQYKTTHLSAHGPRGNKLGYRTVIIPSKERRISYQAKLHRIVLRKGKKIGQDVLIKKLNPIIRQWSNYFGKSDANMMRLLSQMDYLLYLKLRKWSKRIYKTSGKAKAAFRKIGKSQWVFATKTAKLIKHSYYSFPLSKYTKVRGDSSPFDENQVYWANRLSQNNYYNTRITILLHKQKGKCNWCKTQFLYDDLLEVDHIIPKSQGGSDLMHNLQLLHRHCHDIKTILDD